MVLQITLGMNSQFQKLIKVLIATLCFFDISTTLAQHYEFYGTASGGEFGHGAIYKTDENGDNLKVLYSFPVTNEGIHPQGNLCLAQNGKYYGRTMFGGKNNFGVLYEWDSSNKAYTLKYTFVDGSNYGDGISGTLILAKNNKLYGMTKQGGSIYPHAGVIFEWDPETDTYTEKYDFRDSTGTSPIGSLMQADNGKLYGMTESGGDYGNGVLFEWNPETNVYTKKFSFNGNLGRHPNGSLIQVNNSKLYGITYYGGLYDCGVLFEWDIASDTCIKKFDFSAEYGRHPNGSLTDK
jgi:uncharacterized repeat protein (TIGR03803 family)